MEIFWFLILIAWALPMFMSMTSDNDHATTQGGIIIINIVMVLIILGLSKIHIYFDLPKSRWWILIIMPLFVALYFGMWCIFSPTFSNFLLNKKDNKIKKIRKK